MTVQKRKNVKDNDKLLFLGIPALLVLCCALPILLIAIGLSSMGAFLIGKQVWIFGAVLLIVGLIILVKRRGSRNTCQSDCCHSKFSETEEKGGGVI